MITNLPTIPSEHQTARLAQSMFGSSLYQVRARQTLPILVGLAKAGRSITYQDLAARLGMTFPLNLNYPLGSIGITLQQLSKTFGETIPPIQLLVVSSTTKLPGPGVGAFLPEALDWENLSTDAKRERTIRAHSEIHRYQKWDQVVEELKHLGLDSGGDEYRIFWTQLKELLLESGSLLRMQPPSLENFQYFNLGGKGILLEATLNPREGGPLSVGLTIKRKDAAAIFQALLNRRNAIEQEVGFELDWESRNSKAKQERHAQSHIEDSVPFDFSSPMPSLQWAMDRLSRLHRTFTQELRSYLSKPTTFVDRGPEANQDVDQNPIVLVCNEESASDHEWEDEVGSIHHFPNQYRNLIRPGRRFVYYRGVRKADGTRRRSPEYFGIGVISKVYVDPTNAPGMPTRKLRWFAEIEDFVPFHSPVPIKINGIPIEKIDDNLWGVTRELSEPLWQIIIQNGCASAGSTNNFNRPVLPGIGIELEAQTLLPADGPLFNIQQQRKEGSPQRENAWKRGRPGRHRSKRAKVIGDRGEMLVLRQLETLMDQNEWKSLRWVANEGQTPGWDIEFFIGATLCCVEVKATTLVRFSSLDLTCNELDAARRYGKNYWLALVTECESEQPKVQWIQDPIAHMDAGDMCVEAALFTCSFIRTVQGFGHPGAAEP